MTLASRLSRRDRYHGLNAVDHLHQLDDDMDLMENKIDEVIKAFNGMRNAFVVFIFTIVSSVISGYALYLLTK